MDEIENNELVDEASENGDAADNGEIEELMEEEPSGGNEDTGTVFLSVLAGIVGAFAALLVMSVCFGITGGVRYFPFILLPLCICFANILFKGNKALAGLACCIIFTALGVFLAPAFFSAVSYCAKQDASFLTVPLVALGKVGENNFFTDISFSSQTVFPVVFAIIGIAVSWQIGKYYRNRQQ